MNSKLTPDWVNPPHDDPGRPERRTDAELALLIDLVLEALPTVGIQVCAELLFGAGVPLDVAMRVLLSPDSRRRKQESCEATDFSAMMAAD